LGRWKSNGGCKVFVFFRHALLCERLLQASQHRYDELSPDAAFCAFSCSLICFVQLRARQRRKFGALWYWSGGCQRTFDLDRIDPARASCVGTLCLRYNSTPGRQHPGSRHQRRQCCPSSSKAARTSHLLVTRRAWDSCTGVSMSQGDAEGGASGTRRIGLGD